MATEATTGVKWKPWGGDDIVYYGDGFTVRALAKLANWWVYTANGSRICCDNYAPDFATAKRDAERWILEREGRLHATDGGWIACKDQPADFYRHIEVRGESRGFGTGITITHWRPLPVDPHADAACLFGDDRPTVEQARAAARHVAGCAECRAKLEAKGGA